MARADNILSTKREKMLKLTISLCLIFLLFINGCSGPDSISVIFGEQKLLPYDIAWRGVTMRLTWNLEENRK
jgi:hypothetical protein